ncbi:hypothetical protein I4F81_010420 [Pyropia yezoensis]|uniref:Uncharacterized protein n=1 Tax=Pyropia yezoensis TaxID=2788 RepID=A0ACC3CCW4_PYRYE|nr:hypothetical protein I4F81_010420 [Neopyropia yezoensis]
MAGGSHRRAPAGSHAQVVNLVGACLLMLIAGSTYSLSIFSPAMDALRGDSGGGSGSGGDAHPLAGVWSSSLGLMSLVSAPAMLAAGLVLSATPGGGGGRSRLARRLSLCSAACFGCLAFAADAASRRWAAAMTLAVAAQGVALGVYYLLAVELLAAWAPRRRTGLATGVGMTAFGGGGMVFAAVFASLVRHLGAVGAVYATAALWAVPCLALTPWLSFPPEVDGPDAGGGEGVASAADPATALLSEAGAGPAATAAMATATVQAGGGYGVFFDSPEAAAVAGLPLKFAVMNGVGIAARLAGGIAVDILVVPGSRWLWSGAKNSLVLLMVVQTVSFLAMAVLGGSAGPGGFGAFFAALVTLYVAFSATAGNLAVLSREVFSPANGSAVFGVAAGLMMGVGEAISAGGIAVLNFEGRRQAATAVAGLTADGVPRSAYNAYYLVAAAASAGALGATLCTHRVEAAFEVRLPDGSVGVLVDVTDLAAGQDGVEAGVTDAAVAAASVASSPAVDDAKAIATAMPVGADGLPRPARPLVAVPGSTLDAEGDSADEDDWDSDSEEADDDFTLVSSYKAAFSLRDRVYVARPKTAPGPATYAGPSVLDSARGPPV